MSIRQLSPTVDEGAHIAAGYQYWKDRDFGANPEHPPLVKLIATIPLLWRPTVTAAPPANSKVSTYERGRQILYSNNGDLILFRTRLAASVFTYLLTALVFCCGYEMFGSGPALLGLLVLVFEPNILAHGALVTTDIGVTCFMFAAVYAFYRYVKRLGAGRLLTCGCAVTLALAAKHSGLLLIPILVILAWRELLSRRRLRLSDSTIVVPGTETGARQSVHLGIAIVGILAVGFIGLWAFYAFRFAARPHGGALFPPLGLLARALDSPLESAVIRAAARTHLLPESYLWGLADILHGAESRATFLFGTVYATGRWFYFPSVFVVKSTLGFLLLVMTFGLSKLTERERPGRELLVLIIPPAFYFSVSMAFGMNLGIRHILPTFPFLIVLAAASAWSVAERSRITSFAVAAVVLLHAASSLHAFPNYLAYSNEAVGGPSKTYRYVSDSNADWGQGLKQAGHYVAQKNITNCWFAYSVPMVDPGYYHIPCRLLPSAVGYRAGFATPVQPRSVEGTVLVSAVEAGGQGWGPGELNPYKMFFDRKPDEMIGDSILVFHGSFDLTLASAATHAIMAQQLLDQRRPDRALVESRAAVQLAPNSAEMRAGLCQVLTELDMKAEAQLVCQTALSIARRIYPEYQFLRGPRVREIADMQ